jgi:hypothetical protein
MRKHPNIVIS